jgi:hypothetical protein
VATAATQTNVNKIAVAAEVNDVAMCVNGGAVGTDTSATTGALGAAITIGNRTAGARAYNGLIQQIMVLPREMSDAELQAVTT